MCDLYHYYEGDPLAERCQVPQMLRLSMIETEFFKALRKLTIISSLAVFKVAINNQFVII